MLVWFAVLSTKPNTEHSVYSTLYKMDEVEYVYPLFGEWDLIIKITGESMAELKSTIDKVLEGEFFI